MTRAVNPRVAALIYGDGEQPADSQLRAQLDSQVVAPVETLFIHSRPGDLAFASEVSSALSGLPRGITWIWLLDSSVELSRSTLAELLQRAEVSPSAAIIGAKQLRQQDRSILSSLGISISQLAEPVRLRSGEFDQGQHDADSDVLAADPNCSLVLRDTFEGEIGALATSPGQAFGYELGMRVRAAGRRVLVEPRALCWVDEPPDANKLAGQFAVLTARIHLAFLTLPLALVLGYLVLAPLLIPLSIGSALLRKLPAQAIAAPAAIVWSWVTVANRLRARASLRVLGDISGQRDFWLTRSELRKLRMMNQSSEIVIAEARTRLFESGVVWWLLVPLLATFQLFAYGVAQSGELAPLSGSLPELVRTAFVTQQPYSDGVFTTTDPSSWLWLVFGLLSPAEPGLALSWLLFLAPTFSFLIAARLLAELNQRTSVVTVLSLTYALNPVLISAVLNANAALATVLVLLPFCALAIRRIWLQSREQSWTWWAGLGLSLFALSTVFPLIAAIAALAIAIAILIRQPNKLLAATLTLAPSLLLTLLHSFELVASDTAWAIPLPTTKILLSYEIWWLAPLCLVLVAWAAGMRKLRIADFLALIFLVTAAGAWIWISTLAPPLLAAALVTALLSIAAREKQPVTGRELISARWGERLTAAALLVASTTGVGALLLQPIQYQQGDSILMPALISATAEVDPMVRTLVINTEGENLSAELVWNDGRHLDETSQRIEVIAQLQGEQTRQRVARLVAGLVAGNSQVASPELDGLAIGYILVSDPSAELTRSLATIDGLASSGQTEYGDLWRNTRYETSGISSASPSITQWVLLVLLSGLALLAIPKPRLGRRSAGANPIFDEVTD